jgi:hypothetical protein
LAGLRHSLILLGSLAAGLLAGCQDEQIERYQAPREERAPLFPDNPSVRLLGAIVPHGDSTWFFKLAGPVKAVDQQKDAFTAFVRSVRFDDPDRPIAWTRPEGWDEIREKPGGLRYATLRLGPKDARLDLTVTRLGREGEASSVLANVNRWRRVDLGLNRAIHEADLAAVTRTEEVAGESATFVDMGGPGVTAPRQPTQPGGGIFEKPSLKYDTPEGWKPVPGDAGFVRAEAAFQAGEGDRRVDVTVTATAGEQAADLVENVARWRKQLRLPPADENEMRRDARPITVDGSAGHFFDLTGPESEGARRQRFLVVMVTRGRQTWSIKMSGPPDAVERQRAAFDRFVGSLRFEAGKGDSNG